MINSSPTLSISLVVNVPDGQTMSIDIPMSDVDGDRIVCRFASNSYTLGGVIVDECCGICASTALPPSTKLISSNNNTCTVIVTLSRVSYDGCGVAIQ